VAPKVSKSAAQSGSAPRRLWRNAVLMLAIAAIATSGGLLWLRQARLTQLRASLPPAVTKAPNPTLRGLLERARAEAEATGSLPAVAELGRLMHANGFNREAEACWRLLIQRQPDQARWHHYLADLHRAAGDYASAEAEWQAAVATDSTAAAAWLQLAELKFKTGRHPGAEADYQHRLALLPGDPHAGLGLARIAQQRGQMAETLSRLERILKDHPKFSAAQNLYAELQAAAGRDELADHHRWLGREAGRFREADDPWMDELNERCHEPKRLCHLGTIEYQTGRGDLGRARFERALSLAPGDPLAYQLLGELLLEQKSAEAARDVLSRGVALAQGTEPSPTHYLKLGEACQALNQLPDARRALEEGLARHPRAAELHAGLGNLLAAEGRTVESIAAHRRAVELNPALGNSDFAIAVALLEQGRREEALQALHHALQMQPTFPNALLLLARLEMDAGRFESAGEHLVSLLKANPGVPEVRQIVARWRLQAGQALERTNPAAMEAHYRAGVTLQPDNAELNAGLGVHLLMTDRVPEALPLLETYYRLQPASAQAALFLSQAYARSGRIEDARRVLTAGLAQAEQTGQVSSARNFREILSMLPK
jgi:tetratricopeptide (TPR) repeat protein